LKQKVWDFTKTPSSESALAMLGYTIDQQALTTDFVFYRLRLHTQETLEDLLPPCIDEKIPILFKLAFVKACLAIVQDENPLPWNPPIAYHSLSVLLRKLFLQTIQIDMNKSTKTYSTHSSRVELLHDMLRLFKMDTLLCLLGDEDRAEQNSALMVGLATLFQHPTQTIRLAAGELLIKIHQPDHIAQWGPQSTIMYNFWQISSQAVFVLARQMLEHKSNEENIKALLGLLHKLLKTRNAFLKANKVRK
jgi:neurofibromin 1